jgi:hypothetical protein
MTEEENNWMSYYHNLCNMCHGYLIDISSITKNFELDSNKKIE